MKARAKKAAEESRTRGGNTSYRVDELARKARTTVRNIRAYQERGLLAAPRREGRLAFYDDTHLARLRLIDTLLGRGYSLGSIGDLLASWESGSDLRDVLGLEAAITSPFTSEAPEPMTLAAVAELFGTVDPMALATAIELGLFKLDGSTLVAPSMRLVRVGAELHRAGIPLPALLAELSQLRASVDRIAEGFVALVSKNVFHNVDLADLSGEDARRLRKFVERVRPMAELAVDTMLAQSLDVLVKRELADRLLGMKAAPQRKRPKPSK